MFFAPGTHRVYTKTALVNKYSRGRPMLVGLGLLFCACAGQPAVFSQPGPVYLTNTRAVHALSAAKLGTSLSIYQGVEGFYQKQSYYLEAIVQATPSEISVTALSNFGTQVYDLVYNDSGIKFSGAQNIKPEYMLVDFELCYFPASSIKEMLEPAGLALEETAQPGGWVRKIYDGKTVLIEIARSGRELRYRNLLRGYGYTITERDNA